METKIDIDSGTRSSKEKESSETTVQVLCFDISGYSQLSQFIICCSAVFLFYIIYGYLQEYIFAMSGFRPYGWYLTLVQFFYYSVFGWIETSIRRTKRNTPIKVYLFLAFLTLGTIGFSNASLTYLNYPTQVIFKSCKLIPVMIGGILIQKKRYKPIDFAATVFLCIGLIAFTLANSHMSPDFNILGVFMISCALSCDAVIGNVQEKVMKKYDVQNSEIVLFCYFFGFVYLFCILLLTDNFFNGFSYGIENPSIYFYALLFSLSGYLGVQVVLTLIRTCGALTAVTVTTCRKAVSVIISFMLFRKPFTITYIWAGLFVVVGIYLNIFSKSGKQWNIEPNMLLYNLVPRTFLNNNNNSRKKTLLESV